MVEQLHLNLLEEQLEFNLFHAKDWKNPVKWNILLIENYLNPLNCLVQSQVDITELLCPRHAAAGDRSRRNCEDSVTPCGFINPCVTPDAETQSLAQGAGRMSHTQRLESKAEDSPARLLLLSALCRERLGGPSLCPPGRWERWQGQGPREGCWKKGHVPETAWSWGAERSPQLLPGAALGDPQEADTSSVQARQTISLLTSLLELELHRTCSLWVTHMLFWAHCVCQRSSELDSQGWLWLLRLASLCSAEPSLPSPLRIETSEWQSCRDFSWKVFLALLESHTLLQRKN